MRYINLHLTWTLTLKLKHFLFLDVQWKPQICPLFETLETQMHQICVLSLQKIMGGHETGGAGAKLGGLCPHPKTACCLLTIKRRLPNTQALTVFILVTPDI